MTCSLLVSALLLTLAGPVSASPSQRLLVSGAGTDTVHSYDRVSGAASGPVLHSPAPASPQSVVVSPDHDLLVADATPRQLVVEQLYRHFLNRAPEQGGGNNWTMAFLRSGMTLESMRAFFMGSAEAYLQRGATNTGWVNGMFQTLLGRDPHAPVYAAEKATLVARLDDELAAALAVIEQTEPKPSWWNNPLHVRRAHAGAASRWAVARAYSVGAECSTFLASQGLETSFTGTNRILRYDGSTGAYEGVFAVIEGLDSPSDMAFGPDGHLYVTSPDTDSILRLDGATGQFLGYVVQGRPFEHTPSVLDAPTYLAFGPQGLYVSSFNQDRIELYNHETGEFIGATPVVNWSKPEGLAFGPDGSLYVSSYSRHQVLHFNALTGQYLGVFAGGSALRWPRDLAFREEGGLFVTSLSVDQVLMYSHDNGAFVAPFTASTPLQDPSYLLFTGDLVGPVVSVPAHITAEATTASGAVVTFSVSAHDAVDGDVPATASPASGSTFPVGTTTVLVTAADVAGNQSTRSFLVTVRDTTPPVISGASVDIPVLRVPNHKMVDVTVDYTVTDNTGATVTLEVTSNEPDNGLGDGDTEGDIVVVDNRHVKLRAERSGTGSGRIYTITIIARDGYGNESRQQVTVSVPKSQSG